MGRRLQMANAGSGEDVSGEGRMCSWSTNALKDVDNGEFSETAIGTQW